MPSCYQDALLILPTSGKHRQVRQQATLHMQLNFLLPGELAKAGRFWSRFAVVFDIALKCQEMSPIIGRTCITANEIQRY